MMGVLRQVPLGKQGVDLLVRQAVPGSRQNLVDLADRLRGSSP
jgi:hypothetical protein